MSRGAQTALRLVTTKISASSLTEPQEILSRQAFPEQGRRDAKEERKISSYFSELVCLAPFRRVIFSIR
jgi:hypothetical protein